MSKTEDKMTGKQRAFARALALGDEHGKPMSISDCYRECYQTENMSDAVIRNEASKLASHRGVTMMVERLRRENERSALAQAVGDQRAGSGGVAVVDADSGAQRQREDHRGEATGRDSGHVPSAPDRRDRPIIR